MPPVSIGTSRYTFALESGRSKLWMLLVGVNEYQDQTLANLRYSALDCQGLGQALQEASQAFPQKEIILHHDFVEGKPTLAAIKASLAGIVASAQAQDTVLFYFSGHGLLDPNHQQTVLCLADTQRQDLLNTGLRLNELLALLNTCPAHSQLVWLDACHCGNMTLTGAKGGSDPTGQLLDALRQRAANSKGFYALLSCDQGQQSWEFPDLGHGVFSYYLMRGLRGEAANEKGVIEADGLYRYVYHQTLQYIEKANQQLRLINQQKRHRGEPHLYAEYSLQTPKRIVEGVGELILGLKDRPTTFGSPQRRGLMVEGLAENQTGQALRDLWQQEGHFALEYLSAVAPEGVRHKIQSFLQASTLIPQDPASQPLATLLLYLRGRIEDTATGESFLVLQEGVRLSRSWLRQELRRSQPAQWIVILEGHGSGSLAEWIEELKIHADRGQCLLGAIAPDDEAELFAQVLLESLIAANPQAGLSVAQWLTQLQTNCEQLEIPLTTWLSGFQGVIDILPGQIENWETIPKILEVTPPREVQAIAHPCLSPEQYASLTQLLTGFIGPVALTLLQSLGEIADSSNVLIDGPSQYLSPTQKIELDRWASFMVEKKESLTTVPPPSQKAIAPRLSSEQYAQLESVLKEFIGPIAPMLLQQMSEQFPQPEWLIASLHDYLTPNQKVEFERKTLALLASTKPLNSMAVAPPETAPTTVDRTSIEQWEAELTQSIGPVAQLIIATILQEEPQISRGALIERICAEIPNVDRASHFRQRWSGKV
jgi:uncharacterized caspase-like protein